MRIELRLYVIPIRFIAFHLTEFCFFFSLRIFPSMSWLASMALAIQYGSSNATFIPPHRLLLQLIAFVECDSFVYCFSCLIVFLSLSTGFCSNWNDWWRIGGDNYRSHEFANATEYIYLPRNFLCSHLLLHQAFVCNSFFFLLFLSLA